MASSAFSSSDDTSKKVSGEVTSSFSASTSKSVSGCFTTSRAGDSSSCFSDSVLASVSNSDPGLERGESESSFISFFPPVDGGSALNLASSCRVDPCSISSSCCCGDEGLIVIKGASSFPPSPSPSSSSSSSSDKPSSEISKSFRLVSSIMAGAAAIFGGAGDLCGEIIFSSADTGLADSLSACETCSVSVSLSLSPSSSSTVDLGDRCSSTVVVSFSGEIGDLGIVSMSLFSATGGVGGGEGLMDRSLVSLRARFLVAVATFSDI